MAEKGKAHLATDHLLPPIAGYVSVCRPYEASVFETTIRVVGGMLAAFDLSNDRMFIVRFGPGTPSGRGGGFNRREGEGSPMTI